MIVYFLRHASAGNHAANPVKDAERPLDKDGIEQCRQIGGALGAMEVQVDAVITSPLKRAVQTASRVAREMGFKDKLTQSPALRPDAEIESFRELLVRNSRSQAIMVVGHNPSLSQFLSLLISQGGSETSVDLKKAAVARVDASSRSAELKWCLTPKVVQAIYETTAASSRPKTARK